RGTGLSRAGAPTGRGQGSPGGAPPLRPPQLLERLPLRPSLGRPALGRPLLPLTATEQCHRPRLSGAFSFWQSTIDYRLSTGLSDPRSPGAPSRWDGIGPRPGDPAATRSSPRS